MRVYVDGSALVRYLDGVPHSRAWQVWAAIRQPDFVVTSLSVSELRAAAAMQPAEVRAHAHHVAHRLVQVRFSDQALKVSAMVTGVLSPFGALHLGVAVADPEIDMIATYDERLAQVAHMYKLAVVSPGLPDSWWA